MAGFMDKIKGSLNVIGEKFKLTNAALAGVIKENSEMLLANEKLSKESKEGIASLKNYANTETPAVKEAFNNISQALEQIEGNREKMVAQLRKDYIAPLNKLIEGWKTLQTEIKEADDAAKKLEGAKKDLEKVKAKPAEKKKPNEEEQAAAKLTAAQEKATKEGDDVAKATAKFNEEKIKALKDALNVLADSQKDFYAKAVQLLDGSKTKIAAIDVQKEATVVVEAAAPAADAPK